MSPSDDRPSAVRRRGAQLEATILEAAWAELTEVGYQRLTMEGVAARAHTGKQVLYRRWPNRAQLVMAALRHNLGPTIPEVPDTGDLREDILCVLRLMGRRWMHANPEMLHGLLAELPDLGPAFFGIMAGVMTTILTNAVLRGELTHANLSLRVVTLPIDLMRYEAIRSRPAAQEQMTEQEAELEVENVSAAIVDEVVLPLLRTLAGRS